MSTSEPALRPGDLADTEAQRRDDSPHDGTSPEPLGPATPDERSELGDTPEVHDGAIREDFPPGHPSRPTFEQLAGEGGSTRGNVASPLPGWLRRLFRRERPGPGSRA